MWYGSGSSDQYRNDLERLNRSLKPPTQARLEAMRKQCGKGCNCDDPEGPRGCKVERIEKLNE